MSSLRVGMSFGRFAQKSKLQPRLSDCALSARVAQSSLSWSPPTPSCSPPRVCSKAGVCTAVTITRPGALQRGPSIARLLREESLRIVSIRSRKPPHLASSAPQSPHTDALTPTCSSSTSQRSIPIRTTARRSDCTSASSRTSAQIENASRQGSQRQTLSNEVGTPRSLFAEATSSIADA